MLGHDVLFLERDTAWYAENRDLAKPAHGRLGLYRSVGELKDRFRAEVQNADLVIVGSYVPEGIAVGDWVLKTARNATAFYDIDTPVTLAAIERADCQYLSPGQICSYGLYLSFTGGPTLERVERRYNSPMARVLYCSVDPDQYYPEKVKIRWDLGYLATYSPDRQQPLEQLLLEPARVWKSGRFAVVGALFPESIAWPKNVKRKEHLPPAKHREFYNRQRFTLNVTRADMIRAGYSPSVRLFEAAACGVPIISDYWTGLEELFAIGSEILISRSGAETLQLLRTMSEQQRGTIGHNARSAVLRHHTYRHRAQELTSLAWQTLERLAAARSRSQARSRNVLSSGNRIPRSGKCPLEDSCSADAVHRPPA